MKLSCVAAALLVSSAGVNRASPAQSPSTPGPVVAQQAKLRRAEKLAERFVRRLHETLDYGPPYRELYATDPELLGRQGELQFPFGLGPEAERLYGSGVPGRVHVAFMNAWYLRNVYCAARALEFEDLPEVFKALNGDELFFIAEGIKPREKKNLADWRREAEEYLARLNRLAVLFRQGLPPEAFDLPAYKSRVERFEKESRKAGRLARVEHEGQFVKMAKGVPVYVVRREFMDYYFVETRGELKVVFVNILPDFSWPGL